MQQEEDKKLRDKLKELRGDGKKDESERKNIKIIKGEIVCEVNGVKKVLYSLEK